MIDPASAVDSLKTLLEVEEIDTDLFRGLSPAGEPGRVFGGQVMAQALAAAARSIDPAKPPQPAHSLHAYFLRAGDTTRPILYRVLRDFDGHSFANRRVVAMQAGRPILNLATSFHLREGGFTHAAVQPDLPPPEQCPTFADALAAAGRKRPATLDGRLAAFDIRPVPPASGDGTGMPSQQFWFRLAAPLGEDPVRQRVLLTYCSDFALLTTALLPHGVPFFSSRLQIASLDHALWFHADPPIDDWLLYAMDSPWAGNVRGFNRGMIFDRAGHLVASVAQEGLIRPRE